MIYPKGFARFAPCRAFFIFFSVVVNFLYDKIEEINGALRRNAGWMK
jgi:hypothetical protein